MPERAARLLFQLPQKSRVFCAIEPANEWGWREVLANKANYLLETLAWQKTKDAQKGRKQTAPKPYVPDFMKNIQKASKNNVSGSVEEIENILNKPRK